MKLAIVFSTLVTSLSALQALSYSPGAEIEAYVIYREEFSLGGSRKALVLDGGLPKLFLSDRRSPTNFTFQQTESGRYTIQGNGMDVIPVDKHVEGFWPAFGEDQREPYQWLFSKNLHFPRHDRSQYAGIGTDGSTPLFWTPPSSETEEEALVTLQESEFVWYLVRVN